jgi:N6-adenosine-specific RNA methylase IME4
MSPPSKTRVGKKRPGMNIDREFKNLIPALLPDEYKQLEANIRRDGCHEPLSVWNGILVDGHNRYEICQQHGIKFDTRAIAFASRDRAKVWIGERQLGRRNISDDQRVMIADDVRALRSKVVVSEKLAKARAVKAGSMEADSAPKEKTRKAVATEYELPEKKLRHAASIKKAAPEVAAMVRAGTLSLTEGRKLAGLPCDSRKAAVDAVARGTDVRTAVRAAKKESYNARIAATNPKPLEGTYRIFYIDPPWKYVGLNQADEYGHAEAHYECLDDNQLIKFKPDDERLIKDLADDNAILFLWVTAPLLERAFPIIRAWGFKYKANFVWDKIDHVMGFYNSVRHEHLLIATKRSCTPDVKKLFDSVQSIKRTEHSRKPHEFYNIIETLYDHGRKLEIFARSGREGWDSVGNEAAELAAKAAA